jgi:hypothetical protein
MRRGVIRSIVELLIFVVCAAGSVSCSKSETCCATPSYLNYPCTVTADCPLSAGAENGKVTCDGSYCHPSFPCESDKDCSEVAYCSTTTFRCELQSYCATDADCTKKKAGLICNPTTRYCDYPPGGDEDSDGELERDSTDLEDISAETDTIDGADGDDAEAEATEEI